jgi:ketosteroid isomerase-like protein
MKYIKLISLTLLLAASTFAQAGDDKKAALDVVNRLFDAMAAADAAAILATGTKDNQLAAVQKGRDGKTRTSAINGEQFTKFFTKPGAVKEVMYDPKVVVDGDWAMVWGRYVFFAEGRLNHCGINQFNLARTADGWKIINGASTIFADQSDCTDKEKKMKP